MFCLPKQADLAPLPKVLKEARQKEQEQQQQQEQQQASGFDTTPAAAAPAAGTAAAAKPVPVPDVHTQEVIDYWNKTDLIIDTMFKRWAQGIPDTSLRQHHTPPDTGTVTGTATVEHSLHSLGNKVLT